MDLIDYLEVFRRRWVLIVAATAVAMFAVWVTLPSGDAVTQSHMEYKATATIVLRPSANQATNLSTVALYATAGDVPKRAAKELGGTQDPQVLASLIKPTANPENLTVTISTVDKSEKVAAERANVFARQLVEYFGAKDRIDAEKQLAALRPQLQDYAIRLKELDARVTAQPGNSSLSAERAGLSSGYQAAISRAITLQDATVATSPLELLQPAVPIAQPTTGFAPPSSPVQRLMIGTGVGLLLGLALALLMERLDSRLRTREHVEQEFHLPVIAEIPGRPWRDWESRTVVTATDPGGAVAEAYRALRSAVLLMVPDVRRPGGQSVAGRRHPEVILVTSANPGEGKSATVANLAVVMAESGRRVLILSMDFRDPAIDAFFNVGSSVGLSDLLGADRGLDLANVVRETDYPDVLIATAGTELGHPGALLAGAGPLIRKARKLADVVIIDTAPLLTVSDAVDVSPHVDAALIVVRANRATSEHGRSAHRLLSRMGVPALGAVLVGSSSVSFDPYPTWQVRSGAGATPGAGTRRSPVPATRRDTRSPRA
ncbi:polysaccharide biosynthesis tyrosine autokinase [Nocardioides mesophilus]|uniref:Polysaccharide biosynthesis tyrosine autokinase n=1 Tax=Nocardioides mesophilus TaxID=433659 RepID=A0A7G9R995_9ACTN|nr:polysaccharide biosynthesis tyrosine autokinase [Nocardioides mesophilus]QNN52170.1 hypothetical protein H9L09_16965 [Nocardioides mesophilus]